MWVLVRTACGYSLEPPGRGGSKENPQSMFLSRNKKTNVYPCKPQFYDIKVGLKGGFGGTKLYRHIFVMENMGKNNSFWATVAKPIRFPVTPT